MGEKVRDLMAELEESLAKPEAERLAAHSADRTERLFCAALVTVGDPVYINAVLRRYLAWRDGREPEPTWAFPQGGEVEHVD